MGGDSKNDVVGGEVALTPTGFKAKMHSKAVSAIDWLLAGKVKAQGLDKDR